MTTLLIEAMVNFDSWVKNKADNTNVLMNALPTDIVPALANRTVLIEYPLDYPVEFNYAADPATATIKDFINFVVNTCTQIYKSNPGIVLGVPVATLYFEGVWLRDDGRLQIIIGNS